MYASRGKIVPRVPIVRIVQFSISHARYLSKHAQPMHAPELVLVHNYKPMNEIKGWHTS